MVLTHVNSVGEAATTVLSTSSGSTVTTCDCCFLRTVFEGTLHRNDQMRLTLAFHRLQETVVTMKTHSQFAVCSFSLLKLIDALMIVALK